MEITMRMASISIDKSALACIFLATIIFVCLILFAASDFRGTDQYWYVGDVETLLEGGKTTNNVYPAQIMSPEAQIPCPFMHNILNLYLVLPAARIFGAFEGWVLTNMLATVLTASLIALLVATVADKWISILTYTVYLLLPLTIWQSAQPLAEATITPFVALGVLTYVRAETNKKLWFLTVAAACAAYYCRASFQPILFLVPIAFLLQNKPVRIKNALWGLTFLSFAVLAVIIGKMIFVQGMPTSFYKMLNNAIPGVTGNMHFLFSTSPRPISLQELWLKVTGHLSYQLSPPVWHLQIFYLPFNLLAALSLYLYFTKKSMLEVRVAHCAMSLLLLHIATIMVHQNQFRYLLVTTPAVLVAGAVMLNKIKVFQSRRTQLGLILATILLLTVSNAPLVTRLHREGLTEKELRTILNSTFDNIIPQDESLMVDASNAYNQIFGYVLRPRTVIFVKSNHKYEEYQAIREKGNLKWLLCPLNSPLVDHLDISSPPVFMDFPHPYKDYALFQI
jgi:hypothetical protein